MIELDEDALICDLAETYQIYDYRSLPVKLVATLSAGLRDNSRIKLRAAGVTVSQETLLLGVIADRIEMFRCAFAEKGKAEPISMVNMLLGDSGKKSNGVVGFRSSAEFEAALARIKGE